MLQMFRAVDIVVILLLVKNLLIRGPYSDWEILTNVCLASLAKFWFNGLNRTVQCTLISLTQPVIQQRSLRPHVICYWNKHDLSLVCRHICPLSSTNSLFVPHGISPEFPAMHQGISREFPHSFYWANWCALSPQHVKTNASIKSDKRSTTPSNPGDLQQEEKNSLITCDKKIGL